MKTFTNLKESYKFEIIRTCMWMTNSIGLTTRLKYDTTTRRLSSIYLFFEPKYIVLKTQHIYLNQI